MKSCIMIAALMISHVAIANERDWVRDQRAKCESHLLFKYAEKLFGEPANYIGKVDLASSGEKFGILAFKFKNGAKLTFETLQPETSRVELECEKGFPDENEAIAKLKGATAKTGLKIDWSKPQIKSVEGNEIKTYWDPEPGINGQGFLEYRAKKLIRIGYSMAL
jgi:hypothetical protein